MCQLAAQIEREALVAMPERDKKIAALMLSKHQEEQERQRLGLRAAKAWEALRYCELRSRQQLDLECRAQLGRRLESWQQDLAKRKARLRQEERQLRALRERQAAHNERRWHQQTEEQESRRRQEQERTRLQAESRKQGQEQGRRQEEEEGQMARERSRQRLQQRMDQALQTKALREAQERQRLQADNEQTKLRHSSLKQQAESQASAEDLLKRLSIEQRIQKALDVYEQLMDERSKELKEKAVREEEQSLAAKERAERQEQQARRHKQQLVAASEQKIQQARDAAVRSIQDKAGRARQLNTLKERAHHILKQRVVEKEEQHRREVERSIRLKDRKSDLLLREREATLKESRKVARASFHMREKVREQTKSRTFDQMVLEAQLNASLIKEVN